MRAWYRSLLERRLQAVAGEVLACQQPLVVGVTGSVGKTTTVQAIGLALGGSLRARVSFKNYNNEIGVPLSIIGKSSPGRSLPGWLGVLREGRRLARGKRQGYPEVLVLELAADRPGDLAYLSGFVKPTLGVVTSVAAVHLEYFGSLDAVAREKGTLVRQLPQDGRAVLNADDPLVLAMRQQTVATVTTYGFGPSADVRASAPSYAVAAATLGGLRHAGMSCQVRCQGEAATLELPHVLGEQMLYPALAALAVARNFQVPLATASERLRQFVPPPGRMRVVAGIKGTMIIDDSYNSSPLAAQAAVRALTQVPSNDRRKYAVLGDMLELGAIAGRAHRELGGQVARAKLDVLVAVGELARDIARRAREQGMGEERVFTFADARAAGRFLQDRLKPGDVLLVKGSQAERLERLVKELMAEPLRAGELLVRQGPEWGE